jgi:hypothetical protein
MCSIMFSTVTDPACLARGRTQEYETWSWWRRQRARVVSAVALAELSGIQNDISTPITASESSFPLYSKMK